MLQMSAEKIRTVTKSRTRAAKTDQTSRNTTATRITRTKPISYYEEKYPERNLPEGAMVVRFAPSPTGYVHIGGLYQSIICTTLAKQTKGVSILRIEDTDQKRLIENGVVQIVEAVKDFGIVFDEGMINETEEKGNYGPYKQSARKDIYQAFAKYLIEQGKAYPCFATPEELDEMRKKQEAAKIRHL